MAATSSGGGVQRHRPAAFPGRGSGRSEATLEKCNAIGSLLQTAEGYPRDVLEMLQSSVHSCLTTPKDKRHEFQNNIIRMVGEVLQSVEASKVTKVDSLKSKVTNADDEKRVRESAYKQAQGQEQACREALDAAQRALREAEAAKRATEKAMRDLGPELKKAAYDAQLAEAEVSNCRRVLRNFKVLEAGAGSNPASPATPKPVSSMLRAAVAEATSPATASEPASLSPQAASDQDPSPLHSSNEGAATLPTACAVDEAAEEAPEAAQSSQRGQQEEVASKSKPPSSSSSSSAALERAKVGGWEAATAATRTSRPAPLRLTPGSSTA